MNYSKIYDILSEEFDAEKCLTLTQKILIKTILMEALTKCADMEIAKLDSYIKQHTPLLEILNQDPVKIKLSHLDN